MNEVLLRLLDGYVNRLRFSDPADYALAERLAAALRCLVTETALASAADRARVRAAVHYVVLRRERGGGRAVAADLRVVNEILRALGRPDLTVDLTPEPA